MVHRTTRDPNGNLRYHQEHTKPFLPEQDALPKSRQFDDTTATLGVASRGFAFTGMTTDNQGHDNAIHSGNSLLYDPRQNNERFVESRNGARSNAPFKTGGDIFQTTGPVAGGVEFIPSQAEPSAQGQGGYGPSWWDRIKTNFRAPNETQSTNLGTKPAEKYQIGLRASNVKVKKQDQNNGVGPAGLPSTTVTGLNGF
jgi:hypothetical protein